MSQMTIRLVDTPEDMARVELLQAAVWPGADLEVVPAHVLLTVAHNGGLVAGAFDGDRCAGFVWGFPGFDERTTPPRLKHCSHQLGIHPDYRLSGLGFALKRRQWGFVRQQGLDLITWTYDPLMARNARLNIGKLGAVCSTYRRDEYGPLRDALNAGLPTDRFQVDWWLSSERVTARMLGPQPPVPKLADLLAAGARLLNPPSPDGAPQPPEPDLTAAFPDAILVEIPPDFLALKAEDAGLALAWRLGTRAAFEGLFGQGYAVTDFLREQSRALYMLTRETQNAH